MTRADSTLTLAKMGLMCQSSVTIRGDCAEGLQTVRTVVNEEQRQQLPLCGG